MTEQTRTTEGTGLRVIGAGFGRTGTLSMKTALEALGFAPCYHMTELFQHPADLEYWLAAYRGERVDWKNFLGDYAATVDWPGCTYYAELMAAFPHALVVLTVRDPEKWYESAYSTIYRGLSRAVRSRTVLLRLLTLRNADMAGRLKVGEMINEVIWGKTFGGQFEDKAAAIAIYNEHIEEVKRVVPTEKLLVFNVKEGWEPLCAFLGVPVPEDIPFPHLNDRDSFPLSRIQRRIQRVQIGAGVGLGFIAIFGAFFLLRRLRK